MVPGNETIYFDCIFCKWYQQTTTTTNWWFGDAWKNSEEILSISKCPKYYVYIFVLYDSIDMYAS